MRKKACLMWLALATFPVMLIAQPTAMTTDTSSTWTLRPIRNYFRQELEGITENDNYTLQIRDGYYTNGLMFKFSRAKKLSASTQARGKISKVVQSYELGQMIFNPVRFDSIRPSTQDRPFAGYLYGRFDQRRFYGTNQLLQWGITLGTIGSYSYGEQVQRWYHGVVGIYDVEGWPTQLRNEPSLNLKMRYASSFFKRPVAARKYDIAGVAEGNLGNAFTDLGAGILLRAGIMENFCNSVHWNSRVAADSTVAPELRKEFYFFIHPSITWQGYNSTLQGGLFLQDKGPMTAEIEPFYFTTEIGFKFAQNRWNLGLHYVNRTRQAKKQMRNENYVSIQIAYRWKPI